MKHLDDLNFLIDNAAKKAGSYSALAREIGVSPQTLSDWRHARRPCQPEEQALLAAAAGFDPVATLARATVEYWEGKPKGDRLMKALGKPLRATGAVAGFAGAVALAIFGLITPTRTEAGTLALEHNR